MVKKVIILWLVHLFIGLVAWLLAMAPYWKDGYTTGELIGSLVFAFILSTFIFLTSGYPTE